jgi:ATP-dependent exoDNAse (exonuclease V) alpha subunit
MLAMTADWSSARQAGSHAVMIASRHPAIAALNTLARTVRVDTGAVRGPEVTIGERSYAVGDEVIGLRNDRRLGILNGDIGSVNAVDPDERTITVTLPARRNRKSRSVVLHGALPGSRLRPHRLQGAGNHR